MSKVKLMPFDKKFMKSIKNYKKIHVNLDEGGVYYTITVNDKKAGVIGFKYKEKEEGKCFLKIGIHQDFRGKHVFGRALNLLVKKHKIKKIHSTLAKANTASVKAHKKLGFRRIPKKQETVLKKKEVLLKRNIRFVKTF